MFLVYKNPQKTQSSEVNECSLNKTSNKLKAHFVSCLKLTGDCHLLAEEIYCYRRNPALITK